MSILTCAMWAGLSVHSINLDAPEIQLDNPLGHVRAECYIADKKKVRFFIQHKSSIFTFKEEGYGLNEIGFEVSFF